MKTEDLVKHAKKAGYKVKRIEALTQDASYRQYFRIYTDKSVDSLYYDDSSNPTIFILCYLDPKLGSHEKFVEINKSISSGFYKPPKILFYDKHTGITIQEDVGDECLYDLYELYGPNSKNYFRSSSYKSIGMALDLLKDLHETKIPNLKKIKKSELINQMETFESIYLSSYLCISPSEIAVQRKWLRKLWDETIEKLYSQPWVNCHTDFEARNIHTGLDFDWDCLYLIDYQDMCIGPVGIDLAALIFDHYCYHDFDVEIIKDEIFSCFRYSTSLHGLNFEEAETPKGTALIRNQIFEYSRWGAIQRNMRILGTLSNLYLKQNRSFRLPDLEKILLNLNSAIPKEHAELKSFIMDTVHIENNKKIKEIL